MSYTGRDLLLGGLFLALALVIPVLFHAVGLGSAFLPMFFPILVAGFLVSWPVALMVGFTAPIFSALLTGMPPLFPPVAFIMMGEGLFLAGIPALLYQKYRWNVVITLVVTLAADRLVLLGGVLAASRWLHLPEGVLGLASLIRGLPGMALILVLIPPLVKKLQQRMSFLCVME